MAGAVIMVIVLVVVFPVVVLIGGGVAAAAIGSFLKADSDASNRDDSGPNEYLELSHKEAEIGYPQPSQRLSLRSILQSARSLGSRG